MATLFRSESRRMYSWWWDSHICPKNSKWLQENLTDMDVKIKSMIKLIEEDADSFARKAEMYYKKRPELMKLVEEFYRAYRALAERYDHATRVIQDSHSTTWETFPYQVPLSFADDYSSPCVQTDPRPPEMLNPNGDFTDELDFVTRHKTVKLSDDPLGPVERVRRGLNFDEWGDKLQGVRSNGSNTNTKDQKVSMSSHEVKEIIVLKEALATLEAEKEAGIVRYQHCRDKLSNLQSEMSKTREDFRETKDYASKTDNKEVVPEEAMKEEREFKIQNSKQGMDGLCDLQTLLPPARQEDAQKHGERLNMDEIEAQLEVNKSAVENNDAQSNPMQLQGTISNLENKLQLIEDSSTLKERAEKAESELEILKQRVLKLTEEKETAASQHQQCLMTLSSLENKLACAQNEIKGLNVEIDKGVSQMKSAEEKCLLIEMMNRSLRSEMEPLMLKMRNQTKELMKKQKKQERRCISLEEEKESTLRKVEELQALLEVEKQEHASYEQKSDIRFSGMETEMRLLQEQCEWRERELDQVLENAIDSETQLFVLRITAQQMKESICPLSVENRKLKDESMLSTTRTMQLERKIFEQQVEIESLLNQTMSLRDGTCRLMKVLNIVEDSAHEDEADEQYQEYANHLLSEILNMKMSLIEAVEKNLEKTVELSVLSMWIRQLRLDLQNLDLEKINVGEELKVTREQVLAFQNEVLTLFQTNEVLRSKLRAGDGNKEALATQIENVCLKEYMHELHDTRNKRKIQEEILQCELQKQLKEIDGMRTEAASVSSLLHFSMINQLLHEQKALELRELCLYYMDQNKHLKTQLAACSPELLLLKECMSSLENHIDVHIKFQDPEDNKLQGAQQANSSCEDIVVDDKKAFMPSTFSDLRNLRVRLQAIVKAAVEVKEQQVQENANLCSKLDASMRQLELLQSHNRRQWRSMRSTSEITEADDVLLTKDIVHDQISDNSSHCFRKSKPVGVDSKTIELWETGDSDDNIGLTFHKRKKIISPSCPDSTVLCHVKSMKKQSSDIPTSDSVIQDEPRVDKLEISKRSYDSVQEENSRKFFRRLNSDVQTLATLQITVQDLKRKLEVNSRNKRGKGVIECEALKEQLEEADVTVTKLFDLIDGLMKSINDRSSSSTMNSSLDSEGEDGNGRSRKIAQKMAESIGRLEIEVQKMQFSLQKLDNDRKGRKTKTQDTRRRILLKDYLYGGGGGGSSSHRRKKTPFCACIQPSTDEV